MRSHTSPRVALQSRMFQLGNARWPNTQVKETSLGYMFKSTEICDEPRNHDLKIFFRVHLRGQVFLVVCDIYKRNSWLNRVQQMVYFF